MTTQPRVSVLMPARDAAGWIDEAIESIRAQTIDDWALVAVDDGSIDETPQVLAAHARRDARVRVLPTSESERGLAAALNRGPLEVRGRSVARMDADDITHP